MHTLKDAEDLRRIRERMLLVRESDERRWGVMSAPEMICHVRGAFRTAMGEITAEPIALRIPPAALKAIALWAPIEWKKNFESVPPLKRGAPAMQAGDFETDRAEAVREMERFCRPEQIRVDHAFFGAMSFEDWMRWGWLHTDHHLRQFGR